MVYLSMYVGMAGVVEWSAEISVEARSPTRISISSSVAEGLTGLPSTSCGSGIGVSKNGRSIFLLAGRFSYAHNGIIAHIFVSFWDITCRLTYRLNM